MNQANSLTVQELYDQQAARLNLRWLAGREGAHRMVLPQDLRSSARVDIDTPLAGKPMVSTATGGRSLVGYLNLIHPNQIQILGVSELQYLSGLREISRQDAVRQIFTHAAACLIVTEGQPCPKDVLQMCAHAQMPLFASDLSSGRVIDILHYHLAKQFAEIINLHGVFMEVAAIGVLLQGDSGVGKSELALELITRGHRLVADDAPEFHRIAPDVISGTCPPTITGFLEVRGLGIINVLRLFGDDAIKRNKYLRLIIRLEKFGRDTLGDIDRLAGTFTTRRILEVDVPEITLPVASGRNLAVLVECAARHHLLRLGGYNASEDFIARQSEAIAGPEAGREVPRSE